MKLIIAGGGTGGHLFPGIAVAEEFISRDSNNQVLFVGTSRGIEARAVPAAGFNLEQISASGIRGKGPLSKIKGATVMLNGYRQSQGILKRFRPDAVLGVGGYASLPMLLAARRNKITCLIHEQNAVPGMTNRILSKLVNRIFISVEESSRFFPADKLLFTGNPLRRQILDLIGTNPENRKEGIDKKTSVLDREVTPSAYRFHLMVFGGSQGAHAINMAIIASLGFLKQSGIDLEITHQTGENDYSEVTAAYSRAGIRAQVTPFINDMASEYAKADLVVCRSGATTIAEVTATGKACLFIPFPHAVDDHQRLNAEALLNKSACFMLLERDLSPERLSGLLIQLAKDRALLKKTGSLALGMAHFDAAALIVDEIMKNTKLGQA